MISKFFENNNMQLQGGENSYSSGHVSQMIFDSTIHPALLKGKKNKMSVDMEDGIVDANCKCSRGQVICHHMAALCIHAHHNISSTDQACAWNVPGTSRGAEENVLCLKDVYPPKRNYVALGSIHVKSTKKKGFDTHDLRF